MIAYLPLLWFRQETPPTRNRGGDAPRAVINTSNTIIGHIGLGYLMEHCRE